MPEYELDIAVIGAGAAGLMASIWAARAGAGALRICAFDGAKTLGAKILVAGGGRCNVTHHAVDETAYAGSTRPAIKKVLRRFDVSRTIEFFKEIGVGLKREETGKLFPTSDSARTVLNSLLHAGRLHGVDVLNPWRVASVTRIDRAGGGFEIAREAAEGAPGRIVHARRVIMCTGGKSLPKSGSDGAGYGMVRALGHTITERVFPALVPLLLPLGHVLTSLSGLTLPATLEVRTSTGKRLASFSDSTLCTHFGLSGPSVLDISRYYADASPDGARLFINVIPALSPATLDRELQFVGKQTVGRFFASHVPERMARALCEFAGVDFSQSGSALSREQRRALVSVFCDQELPVRGDRGWNYAEVTAGGVPLGELHLETMESRICPGLHLAGELCDVDGRIGGFNFQWAWASGFVAGTAAASACLGGRSSNQDSGSEHPAAQGI